MVNLHRIIMSRQYKAVYLDESGDEHTVFLTSCTTTSAIEDVLAIYKNARRVIRCKPQTPA